MGCARPAHLGWPSSHLVAGVKVEGKRMICGILALILSGCGVSRQEAENRCSNTPEGFRERCIQSHIDAGDQAKPDAGRIVLSVIGVVGVLALGVAMGAAATANTRTPSTNCSVTRTGATVGYVGSISCN